MKRKNLICIFALACTFFASGSAVAQDEQPLSRYFTKPTPEAVSPDGNGFIRRWTILEPISKPNHTNTVFTDSYIREAFAEEHFPNQMTIMPKDGMKVKAKFTKMEMPKDFRFRMDPKDIKITTGTEKLIWHKLDSKLYNIKLFRFGEQYIKRVYGVIYWAITVIDCPEGMKDVRLAVGSNSASMWWVNGEEALILSGDRRMVVDDCVSHRINLKKGINVLRGAIINGPGMSDFCVRFMDQDGNIITNYTIQ